MISTRLTESTEMGGSEPVSIAYVAERLGITPVSANERINQLGEQGLVTHLS